MAGEKLSPRQKMIGMMYLVLTALLALQVSGSVLEKFVSINASLEKSSRTQSEENKKILKRIKDTAEESGNRAKDVEVLQKGAYLSKEAKKIVAQIEALKKTLIELTGGTNKKTGAPKGLKNDSAVAHLMINEKKAKELQKMLNGYMSQLSKLTGKQYAPIALDAKDSKMFKNDPNQVGKDFAMLNFDHTPLGAALATLSQLETEVVYAEADALEILYRNVGAGDMKFDKLVAVVKPQSDTVAAGSQYQAQLFLAASSSGVSPTMSINGKPIPVVDGVGNITFTVKPGKYNKEGVAREKFEAAIRLKTPSGEETVLKENIEYTVVRPIVQIQAAAVEALYLNCGNELNIQVPALGTAYKPKFTATGADVVPGGKRGLVTIIPKSAKVMLNIYSGGTLLEKKPFGVRKIPKPDIRLTSRGKLIDEKKGIPAPGPRSLEVSVIADESFKAFLPKDAQYRVAQWEVSLARGSRALKVAKFNSTKGSLSSFASMAQPGDRLVVEIKKIERRNFRGEIETVKMGSIVHTIPLT